MSSEYRMAAWTAMLWLATNVVFGHAADQSSVTVVRHLLAADEMAASQTAPRPTHQLRLSLGVMLGTGWAAEEVLEAAQRAMRILNQCGIRTVRLELTEFDGPPRYRSLFTPDSRELASRLALPKPTVFFVADTRQRPAFDAEAIGRGNSRTRPEMADTVWLAAGARDVEVVIAHELVHVLTDSGAHSEEPGNLMREDTTQTGTRLTPAQCEAIVKTGSASGLLQPLQ